MTSASSFSADLTAWGCACIMGVSYSTVLRMITSGQLKAYKARGSWRVRSVDLEALRSGSMAPGPRKLPKVHQE